MSRDLLIMVVMLLIMMSYSAYGSQLEGVDWETTDMGELELEFESTDHGLNFDQEIAKHEGQFQVVTSSINGEETDVASLDTKNDPLKVTLIRKK